MAQNIEHEPSAVQLAGRAVQELTGDTKKHCVSMFFSMMKLQRARNRDVFPGANPVSIERSMIPQLTGEDYRAAPKSDGSRYMLMAVTVKKVKVCLFVDRAMRVSIMPGSLPTMAFDNTLLDGEVVYSGGSWRYLVFDCIYLSGLDLSTHPFAVRLQLVRHWLLDIGDGLVGVTVEVKRFCKVGCERLGAPNGGADTCVNGGADTSVPEDGIIFVPNNRPYVPYKNDHLFKWKSNRLHTVDFKVAGRKLLVLSKGKLMEKAVMHPSDDAAEGSIVECTWEKGVWRVLKTRNDKTAPNDLFVLSRTLVNIQEDIQREELMV